MAPVYSDLTPLGSEALDFKLLGIDGKTYKWNDFRSARACVIAFICNHCPYVIAIQGRLNTLAQEYGSRGVQVIAINSNDAIRYPEDCFEAMQVRSQEQGFVFPYLWDETQEVARAYGAVCTPEFYLYSSQDQGEGEKDRKWFLKYKGRLDDHWKDEKAVTRRELAMALDDVLEGREPLFEQKPAMGCSIKWKRDAS